MDLQIKDLPDTIIELEELQSLITKKIASIKESSNQPYKEGLYILCNTNRYSVPPQYIELLSNMKDKGPSEIIQSIIENDRILRFPILMTLLQVWPCSRVNLMERLIQLFDNFIFHRGPGETLARVTGVSIDDMLQKCTDKENSSLDMLVAINMQIQKLHQLVMPKQNMKKAVAEWLNLSLRSLQFLACLVDTTSYEYLSQIFALSVNFLTGQLIPYDNYSILTIPNETVNSTTSKVGKYGIFNNLVEIANSNGSDYAFSKAILPAFRGVSFEKGLAV